jgi:hypothetical protein
MALDLKELIIIGWKKCRSVCVCVCVCVCVRVCSVSVCGSLLEYSD